MLGLTVRVIPFSAGAYAAEDGYFALLEFGENSDLWPVVFVEGLSANQYLERKPDVVRYRETVEYLRDAALIPHGTCPDVVYLENMTSDVFVEGETDTHRYRLAFNR